MLQDEIVNAQRSVKTDGYQMSLGEIVSMYERKEIVINPDFQRLFRWDNGQKSRFIESLLLGIPLPPIFVFETNDGEWELIDGLQRLSTILEFIGVLRSADGDGQMAPPSILEGTKYLPSLRNAVWDASEAVPSTSINDQRPLDKSSRLAIRRARIGVEILKRTSDDNTKYDLFQRLNAGGTQANAQELRNCIMLMVNSEYFQSIKAVAESSPFIDLLNFTEGQIEKQKHMEYAVRFLVHVNKDFDGTLDVEEFVDEGIIQLSGTDPRDSVGLISSTFSLLRDAVGDDALKRHEDGRHIGRVGLIGLEVIAVGVARNLDEIQGLDDPVSFVRDKVVNVWSQDDLQNMFSQGLRGTVRIRRTVEFGAHWFKP